MNIAKNYWLHIFPQVYCCIKNEQLLLYHTQTGAYMENNTKEVVALMQELHQKHNLGAVSIEEKQLDTAPYKSFIAEFIEKDMGGLVDSSQEKPIQLMPVLNLQRDIEKLQKDRERFTGEDVLHYLLELNIYVNDACSAQCPLCTTCFRQNMCCTSNSKQQDLSKKMLQNILAKTQHAPVGKLNILGGNILQYAHYEELETMLQPFKERTHLWLHYLNIAKAETLFSGYKYDIPVTFPVNESAFSACVNRLSKEQATFHFFITGEEDYNQAEHLFSIHAITNYRLHPIYTEMNKHFFEENVYLTKDDIFSNPLSFCEIFAHQKLNTNFFGSLTLMPDGEVYANVNSSALGNITTDTLLDLINKEMNDNTAWRKIRSEAPCSGCLYQYLCPSPANYEYLIGRPNLCHLT
ncbi:MAG: TIGR04150 pseudo-rSAM protein [Prevotellaceae bacterium]|jgi:pseudo-rSAM protein|nr:TIGR04150 pseudo-rSAM protein [Prevotellaceae bacterium]